MTPQPLYLTASEIGEALGMKRQSVAWHLNSNASDTLKIVAGNQAQAWSFENLPAQLKTRLQDLAKVKGYRDVRALFRIPSKQWGPALPIAEIAEEEIERANKLREAQAAFLLRRNETNLTAAEFEAQGVREYRRIFGHT